MPEKMQKGTAAFAVVAVVVIGMLGGLDLILTEEGESAYSFSPCSHSVELHTSYNQSNGALATTTFLIAPGATAEVCIAYSSKGAAAVTPSTGPLACGPTRSANGSLVEDCSGDLAVVASEPLLYHPSGSSFTIVYILRASENASGVHWFWVDCGEFFPVAVGTLPTSLTFPIIPGCVYEPNALSRGAVTGISNMAVGMVRVG